MASLNTLIPQTFSQSTTGYTLGLKTRVPPGGTAAADLGNIANWKELFVIIGRTQTWNPRQSRNVTGIWEINSPSGGERVEVIPGGVNEDTIEIQRLEVYRLPMMLAFGGLEANNLRSQIFPFTVIEYVFDPKDLSQSYQVEYVNCFFEKFDDPVSLDDGGTGPVTTSATIQVAFRRSQLIYNVGAAAETLNFSTDSADWISFNTKRSAIDKVQNLDIDVDGKTLKQLVYSAITPLANVCVSSAEFSVT